MYAYTSISFGESDKRLLKQGPKQNRVKKMNIWKSLSESMEEVEGSRAYDGYYYSIGDVLKILVCGLLCGIQVAKHILEWSNQAPVKLFFAKELGIEKLPSYPQFMRILEIISPEKFAEAFNEWARTAFSTSAKTVSIDGKAIRGAEHRSGQTLNIASALVAETGVVIGTKYCGGKGNEKAAFRDLLSFLDVKGSIVVADALHCNTKSAQCVIKAEANYLFVVKKNNASLYEDLKLFFSDPPKDVVTEHTTTEKNGGRIETRTGFVAKNLYRFGQKYPELKTIGAIRRQFEKDGVKSDEWHFYISSASLSAHELLIHARAEWRVESMHWILDVHFGEDRTLILGKNAQQTSNIARKAVINMVKAYQTTQDAKKPFSWYLRQNLFDVANLAAFIQSFCT